MSFGTSYTFRSSVAAFWMTHSAESAWFANDMSMTSAGWPSAAARLTSLPFADQVQAPAVRERELVDEGPGLARLDREVTERADLDLDVEVARVREDRPVLHPSPCAPS